MFVCCMSLPCCGRAVAFLQCALLPPTSDVTKSVQMSQQSPILNPLYGTSSTTPPGGHAVSPSLAAAASAASAGASASPTTAVRVDVGYDSVCVDGATHTVCVQSVDEAMRAVKGHIVVYPLRFLHDEDLSPVDFTVAQVAPEIYL